MAWILAYSQVSEDDDPANEAWTFPSGISFEAGIAKAEKEMQQAFHAKDTTLLILALHTIGTGNALLGKIPESFTSYRKALKLAEERDDNRWIAELKLGIGILHYNKSEYDMALKYFLEAHRISARIGFYSTEAGALNYIGKFYHSKGKAGQSLKYYEKTPERLDEHLARYRTDGSVVVSQEDRRKQQIATTLPPSTSFIGAGKKELSEEERQKFDMIAGDVLCEFRYQ